MIVIQKKGTELSAFALDRATGLLMETRDTLAPNSAEFELHPVEGTLSYDYDPIVKEVTFEIDDRGYLVTDSNARAIADKLQYSGTFMEMPQLNITVKVPAKIDWEIGDFIVWDYDGLTYTLRELPQVSKQATENTYGEAFVYENVRFVSALADIKYIDFLDVVIEASPSHFSTLPLFSFYGDVFALIDRINANLGRLYNNWEVVAADVESGDVYDALHTLRDVSITSPIKVWDALGLCYSMWGLGFVYHYDSVNAKHIITVGATGGETGNFAYGQGNGLYMVNKNIAKEDAIVTRLRAYGSARNMPSRYYNNKTVLGDRLLFTNPLVYLPNLMLPHYEWDFSAGDPKDAYINCNNTDVDPDDTSYAKYGIREASVYFDGSNNLPEIHPTIEGMTALELRYAIANYTESQLPLYYSPSAIIYGDTVRMDRVKVGDTITDEGIIISSDTYSANVAYAGSAGNEIMTSLTLTKAFPEIFGATLTEEGLYNLTFAGQKVTTTCTDATISFGAVTVWLYKNGGKFVLADRISGTAITNGFEYVIPDIEFSATEAGDNYAVGFELELVLSGLEPQATATVAWAITATTATYQLAKKVPDRTFTIKLKQVGFDVMRFLSSAGLNPVISMTTGACAGREFVIKGTTYNSATDDWTLSCIRQADTSLNNQWFPNANYHIAAEDTFVLLNIDMPEIYINIAEDRLYLAACNWLRRQKEPKWVFEPKIDEVYMAHNPQLIKEGMMMPIEDTDLGITGTKLINSVTITENDGAVRTFDVVLREDADKDLLKYINEAAKYESSSAVSGITNTATNKTQSAGEETSGTSPVAPSVNAYTKVESDSRFLYTPKGLFSPNSGVLITTNITGTEESAVEIVVRGSRWDSTNLLNTDINLYHTSTNISGLRAIGHGTINTVYAFNLGGVLCVWFGATPSYSNLRVQVFASGTNRQDRLVSVTNAAYPSSGRTKDTSVSAAVIYTNLNSNKTDVPWSASYYLEGGTTLSNKYLGINANAVSASKLNTARTLWGQSFDGTGNVTGALTSVTNITASGTISMAENVNTRLTIPSSAPSGMTAGRWYLWIG